MTPDRALPLPPGPGPIERIGYLTRFAVHGDKDAILRELVSRFGPVVRVDPYVILSGPDANRFLAMQPDRDVRTWPNTEFPSLAAMNGESHIRHRKLVMAAFQGECITRYVAPMRAVVRRRMANWGHRLDVHPAMHELSFDALLRTMLGIEGTSRLRNRFEADYWRLIHREEKGYIPFRKRLIVAPAKRRMWALLAELVVARRRAPEGDALSAIVTAADPSVDDIELVRHAYSLMDFGQGDIAIYLTYALTMIALHPGLARRLSDELSPASDDMLAHVDRSLPTTANFLREVERLYPPVTEMHRTAATELAFGGYRIPAGRMLVSTVDVTHHSPTIFRDPERFDPDRFAPPRAEHRTPFALMGFGAGRHMCVAAQYSRVMTAVVLREILQVYNPTQCGIAQVPAIDHRGTLQRPSKPILLMLTSRIVNPPPRKSHGNGRPPPRTIVAWRAR